MHPDHITTALGIHYDVVGTLPGLKVDVGVWYEPMTLFSKHY